MKSRENLTLRYVSLSISSFIDSNFTIFHCLQGEITIIIIKSEARSVCFKTFCLAVSSSGEFQQQINEIVLIAYRALPRESRIHFVKLKG